MRNTTLSASQVIARLHAQLLLLDVTQEQFAKVVGVSPAHMSKLLSGKVSLTGAVLAHLRLKKVTMFEPY